MIKAKIYVMPKKSVLDPQGATVKSALKTLSYGDVSDVRIGKLVEVTLNTDDVEGSRSKLSMMCDQLLVNPNIEEYSIEVETS